MNNKKVPEIRFDGFSEDWEEKELAELLLYLKSGLSRMLSSSDIGLPVIRANNINDGVLDLEHEIKYWYEEDPQGANTNNYLVKENDILINFINSENKMGTAAIINFEPKRKTIYTTNIMCLRVEKKINSYFIFCITLRKNYKDYIKSITKPAVNQSSFTTVDFKNFRFSIPCLEEQEKIGNFFKQLDELISINQKKLENLKQTKQGFLQKMFPKDGELVPEIRFEGFSGDWDLHRFEDDILSIQTGTSLIGSVYNLGIPLIKMGNIQRGYFLLEKLEYLDKDAEISKNDMIMNGDFLFNTRNTLDLVGKGATWFGNSNKYAFNSNIARFTFKNINTYFFNYLYNRTEIINQVRARAVGTTSVAAIYTRDLNSIKYNIPSLKEQEKIGNFFTQLDDTISLQEKELELLKQTKKAFLQKMFV